MKDTRAIISFLIKLRPALMRVVPNSMLRRAKRAMVRHEAKKLGLTRIIPFDRELNPDGMNLFGSICARSGLGQSCRLIADAIEAAGVPLAIVNYEPLGTARDGERGREDASSSAAYNVNIFHINPHELPLAFAQIGHGDWDGRYNIAYWLWELETFPEEWAPCFNVLDEIWTPSEFISQSICKATDKPVRIVPYPISAPYDEACDRRHFNLPEDKFLFLCMYDHSSIVERKNPFGTVCAFKQAFSPDDDAGMVIKSCNATSSDIARIRDELKDYKNVFIINEALPKKEANALIGCADAFMSLHRAEGFGLVSAESMLLGTPVVATNWSANTEFMDEGVAMMVDYELVRIEKDVGPYKAGNHWAEPDIGCAARHMRRLYEDSAFASDIAAKAKAHIAQKFSLENASRLIGSRLDEIYSATDMPGDAVRGRGYDG